MIFSPIIITLGELKKKGLNIMFSGSTTATTRRRQFFLPAGGVCVLVCWPKEQGFIVRGLQSMRGLLVGGEVCSASVEGYSCAHYLFSASQSKQK